VLPNIVTSIPTEDYPDGLLGLSMTEMIPCIVNSIKELARKNAILESKYNELKSKIQ